MFALLLANMVTIGWRGKEPSKTRPEPSRTEEEVLLENVLAENAALEDSFPYLYAKGKITEKELPEKVVFLTFDDGPSKNTEKVLQILADNQVTATFFVG